MEAILQQQASAAPDSTAVRCASNSWVRETVTATAVENKTGFDNIVEDQDGRAKKERRSGGTVECSRDGVESETPRRS